MRTQLDCPCGEHIEGTDEADLVAKVHAHLKDKHPGHEYTDDQVLMMAY